jgi:uncharacterized membrane protein
VPPVSCLVDGVCYFQPDDLPPAAGEDLRPPFRPRLTLAADRRSSRHRDAALAQDARDLRRVAVDLAVEGGLSPAALAQHLAQQDPARLLDA